MDLDALVISGWSVVSPYGMGAGPFRDGLRAGRDGTSAGPYGPFERAGVVPDFDVARVLGRKGTRSMDRVTGLTVATVGRLLDAYLPRPFEDAERVGLVLGTGSGSVQSIMDFTRDALTGERPYHVDPARFPNTVMNRAAGQSAIWYGLKGPNTTVAGGALTGLLALSYTARLHRGGGCDAILCGAAEEISEQRARLEWHANGPGGGPLGEGCAMFLTERLDTARRNGRAPLAVVRAVRFGAFGAQASAGEALRRCVEDALKDAGDPDEVRLVAPTGGPFGDHESAAIGAALGGRRPPEVRGRPLIGDTSAASAAFQLAAVLAAGMDDGLALVTSIDREGTVGCALLGQPGAGT